MLKKLIKPLKTAGKALGAFIGAVLVLYSAFILTFYTGRGEKLTPGEDRLLHDIFGQKIKTTSIRKHFHSKAGLDYKIASLILPGKNAMAMPLTGHMVFFSGSFFSRDFSAEKDLSKVGFFAHEATHILQYQRDLNLKRIGAYKYHLSPEKKFSDFGVEEQAEMVEHYVRRFFYNDVSIKNGQSGDLLKKIIEDRFPAARNTRLALEKRRAPAESKIVI